MNMYMKSLTDVWSWYSAFNMWC